MKNIIIIILIAFIPLLGSAQRASGENIRNKKATYIALRLDLSMEQAIFFKEKYIAYENRRAAIRSEFNAQKQKNYSDTEADQQIQAQLKMDDDLMIAKRDFYQELEGVIPSNQLILLPKAEAEFKAILVKRLRQHQNGKRGRQ